MAELKDWVPIIFGLIIAGIFLTVGSLTLGDIKTETTDSKETVLVTNQTASLKGGTNNTIFTDVGLISCNATTIVNSSGASTIWASPTTYITYSSGPNCMLDWLVASTDSVLVSYDYQTYGRDYSITQGAEEGLQNVSDWQDTWGTVIGAAIVLAIVIGSFLTLRHFW
jgi:hypothetical protein